MAGEPILSEETIEPFSSEYFAVNETTVRPVSSDGYALPEGTATPDACYRTEFLLEEGQFVGCAKSVGATPATFAAMLLSECILDLNPQAEKPIICNMAMDLRRILGLEKTHRNCVASAYLPFTKEDRLAGREVLAKKYRELLTIQRQPNAVKTGLNKQIGLFNKLDELKTLEEKRRLMSIFNGMINNTYVISYMGRLRLNDYAQYVESAHFFNDGICGLTVNMISAGRILSVEVLQGFSEQKYAQAFQKALAPYGLLSVTNTAAFTTGMDKSYLTASRQAQRYYCNDVS